MFHTREEVIERTVQAFEQLDLLISGLTQQDWKLPVPRPESKDPWKVKDALVHITYWRANTARTMRKERRPPEERRLAVNDLNHLIYLRWHGRSPAEVLAWHRHVHADLLAALQAAPDEWYTRRDRSPQWPFDLDGHVSAHRVKDIELALALQKKFEPGD